MQTDLIRASRAALLLGVGALLLFAGPTHAQDTDKGHWPFGTAEKGIRAKKLDLINLGLLGIKARSADRPETGDDEGGGRRSGRGRQKDRKDLGPTRLAVVALYEGGPADLAGVRVGDVLVGAGKAFREGSLDIVAKSLVKAESGAKKGVLTLTVERAGEKDKLKIDVPIPQGGKPAAKPTEGAGRQRILDGALKWLADRQGPDGGYQQTMSGTNGVVVMASLAGLAWLGAGSDLENGPYKENIAKAVEYVALHAGSSAPGFNQRSGGPSWDQTNWGNAHAAIFLGELHQRTTNETVRETLHRCGKALIDSQEKSGGWAHGPGGPNALGYVELNIVTGLAIAGIGLAERGGLEVPESVMENADTYLVQSSHAGGVGYSAVNRGRGNIGRTAGCWLGYRAAGLGKSPRCRKMETFVVREAGNVLGGHASLMQHIYLAGVAAHALGKEARKKYWAGCERSLVLARAPDGSMQARPWHESVSIGSNSDVNVGEVWTTAAWAVVLACEPVRGVRPGLPTWMGLSPKK